ncbi:hypothetical protein M422DRAFT_268257 [Sphaerobolus stellatus SS14]|uniref:Unplaced genomic scaffold SPHSTscaffold_190, whole genome shotgun sequence n=1 Tax=Sphaerobolus stellatus (strain SS14) TaxID=990650 RepID=A0A0C9TKI9_SPHS4|nr:hypothetical protein M422DRAFT_268257 [Sphaerobolus stellatus SS14]
MRYRLRSNKTKFGGHGDIGRALLTSSEPLGVMGVSVLLKPYMAWRLRLRSNKTQKVDQRWRWWRRPRRVTTLHDGPPHERHRPIPLLQHRYARLINNYGQYVSVFYVTLLTGRRDQLAASLVHDQDIFQHIAATMPTSSSSSPKRQSAAAAARQHTADTTIDTHHSTSCKSFAVPESELVLCAAPMPVTHEYAGVKRASAPTLNGAAKKTEDIDVGVATKAKVDATTAGLAAAETAATPTAPTLSSVLARSHSHAERLATPTPAPIPNTSPPTPTNINISISAPSTSASAKHTSLSSSRPAPASRSAAANPSPPSATLSSPNPTTSNSSASNATKASGDLSRSSTRRSSKCSSRPSTSASTSAKKLGVNPTTPTTPIPVPHTSSRGTIHIRDFAYPTPDPRHTMSGPDTPKLIRKILKKYGPPSHPSSRRKSHRTSISSGDSTETDRERE